MLDQLLKKQQLPDTPGVYFFLGKNKKILYIGRATSLYDRVRSYFSGDIVTSRSPLIAKMIEETKSLDYRKTDSVLEAVLLEADLIKKFKPAYNTDLKDDKSFNCVVITDEEFPRVLIIRKKDLDAHTGPENVSVKKVYGPFPEGGKLSLALKLIRKIFPYRDKKCTPHSGKPCFNRQLGLCPGVCTGEIHAQEYAKTIHNIQRLFEGKKSSAVRSLTADMKSYARRQEFEKAEEIKRQLFSLAHIEDVALIAADKKAAVEKMRIEAFDVAHTGGRETVGVLVVVENSIPDKTLYRTFKIKSARSGDDIGALKELLTRRLLHKEWGMPHLIVIDGGVGQLHAAEEVLHTMCLQIPIVSVVKDERHKPRSFLGDLSSVEKHKKDILLANSEAHRFAISFHRRRLGRRLLS